MRAHDLGMAALVVSSTIIAGTSPASAATGGSSANDLAATFTSGATTTLGPVDPLHGTYPPAYASSASRANYSGSVTLPPLVPAYPTLAVFKASAVGLADSVQGGNGVDDLRVSGQTSVRAIDLSIVPSNPSPVTTPPFLSVKAQGVSGSSNYVVVLPGATPSATGTASVRKVRITGSLLGGKVVSFAGTPKPNTTLFSNKNLTVVLNEQIVTVVVSCGATCRTIPASITETPIAIHLTGAFIQNGNVSGEIAVGQSSAD